MRMMIGLLAAGLSAATPVRAHDWYRGLVSPAGENCCTRRDCQPVDHRYVPATGRLEVAIEGAWMPVDPRAVLSVPSPDDSAHACFWRWWMMKKVTPIIRCVILPGSS